jgi:hypothetical protein
LARPGGPVCGGGIITVPDERKFCCVVIDGMRCHRSAEFEIRGAGGELDDYTFTCAGHLELVRRLGDVVTPVGKPTTETDASESAS